MEGIPMNKFLKLAVLIGSVTWLGACGSDTADTGTTVGTGTPQPIAQPITLRLGHIQSESDIWHIASQVFADEVYRLSDGTMNVTLFANSTLGGDRDMGEGMQLGTVDISLLAGVLGAFEPTVLLLELPYLFETQEEFDQIIHGAIGEEIAQNVLASSNIRILNWWNRGSRQITSNHPVYGIEDVTGMVIRVPEISAMVTTWSHMGASPVAMAWAEVFTGLEQGVIDAQENPIPFLYAGSIFEVADYLAISNHKWEYVTMSMSEITWNNLSQEQRDIVTQAAQYATDFQNREVFALEQELLDSLVNNHGMIVTHPNIAELAAVAREAHAPFAETIDLDLFNRIMAELGR